MGYYIVLPFIYLLSALPFPVMYLFSDFVCFMLYRVAGYRKAVVLTNLRNAFPDKSEQELKRICDDFYRFLCDLFIETFKTLTISRASMLRHCHLTEQGKALFDRLNKENQSVILVMGHQGNWEWGGNAFSLECQQQLFVIYHPLTNKKFDGLMYHMRSRFGTKLIAMRQTFREMLVNKKTMTNATAFIADQTPQPEHAQWMTFLNQDTPVFKGTETMARKLDLPIVYVHVKRVRRGYYEVDAEMLVAQPNALPEGAITELHTRRLEQDIIADPATWLWSHKRWKHKRA